MTTPKARGWITQKEGRDNTEFGSGAVSVTLSERCFVTFTIFCQIFLNTLNN